MYGDFVGSERSLISKGFGNINPIRKRRTIIFYEERITIIMNSIKYYAWKDVLLFEYS